jgi:acetoin utilization deacetylase AcuC-like enzyme
MAFLMAVPIMGKFSACLHDVAIAIRRLHIRTAVTVDCDVHQSNGTAEILASDEAGVYLFQEHNYPHPNAPRSLDINLADGTGDLEYLAALERGLDQCFAALKPDLLRYVAGADPYPEDQLGDPSLSRDRLVFAKARQRAVPVAVTFAGRYARRGRTRCASTPARSALSKSAGIGSLQGAAT